MIEALRGRLTKKAEDHILLDVGGVGYGLDIPLSTYQQLPSEGEEVLLHTVLKVGEDALRLFGFSTELEREVFEVFQAVSGVGPKTSLAILSFAPVGRFARALLDHDIAYLTLIPGIGKKTAERLVVELRDALAPYAISRTTRAASGSPSALAEEAVAALEALGCRTAVALKAVEKALEITGPSVTAEALVKEALKHR